MVAIVKVLVNGFIDLDKYRGWSSTSLVLDKDIVMVLDPGTVYDPNEITEALKKEGFSVGDINYVCISHSHLDHYRNIGIFPKAKSVDFWGIWDKDKLISKEWNCEFSENIYMMKTPGHNYDGITIFVKTKKGTIALCGDVFWREDYPEEGKDPFAQDQQLLSQSRKKVIEKADWIVPGHDKIFKVKK